MAGAIWCVVNDRSVLGSVPTYGSETMIWRKERSMIRGVQMDLRLAGYRVNGLSPECTDKAVVKGDERCR